MKKLLPLLFFFSCINFLSAKEFTLLSPSGQLKIIVSIDDGTQYEIHCGDIQLISPSPIGLNLNDGTIIGKGTVKATETRSVNTILPVLIGKNASIPEIYNELAIQYNENYDLIVRAYNEGLAFRWITALEDSVIIDNEDFVFNFPDNPIVYFPEAFNLEHWEKNYTVGAVSNFGANRYAVTPILFSWTDKPHKIVIAESDLFDYPGLYIQATGSSSMKGMWAKYPDQVSDPNNIYSNHVPVTRFDYIARTSGSRTYPWRVFAVSENDKDLLNNQLVYLLAEPNRLENTDWIVPGKTTWEWWHKAMLTPDGKADPANGIPANGNDNRGLLLYRYYVDFAAANNLEYLTLDAGHGLNSTNLRSLCQYAASKNVKIILWTWASQALEQRNFITNQKNYGIAGLKIDFFQRNDQIAMTWGHRLAKEMADLEMFGLFHGCPIPTGLNRTYPNILNFEAILGNEENFWRGGSDANYHVQFPFIRSLAGPEDYTPGSLRNTSQLQFYARDLPNTVPFSQGTRAHEMAMYIVFDHWLAYLCDAPTEYMKYPDILDYLANVPTTWDKTLPLDSHLGEYITIAKQSGADWYVGGMSSWTAHDVDVDFGFLPADKKYTAFIIRDGVNASTYPTRYLCDTITVDNMTKMTFNMAKGGGFVVRLRDAAGTGIEKAETKTGNTIVVNNNELLVSSNENIKRLSIYSLDGQLVANHDFSVVDISRRIGLSGYNRGIYIVEIQKESSIDSLKFIY